MGNNHIISIEKEAKLSIDTGRLEITFIENHEKHYFAPFDIAVLILAHPCILLSSAVSKELSSAGAVIIYAGDNFMPIGITLPIGINQDGAKRPHQQVKYLNTPIPKHWWRQVIKSKILGQAKVLEEMPEEGAQRLTAIANKVEDGDEENKEGQAARFYWGIYFNKLNSNYKREKQGATDVINSCLNYSYAIIRSMIARALTSAGLCLNFGIGHIRKDNPFNLVEDFIEPFRFIADKTVFNILSSNEYEVLNAKLKKELLAGILSYVIEIQDKSYRLFEAVDFAIVSFCNSLDDPRRNLLLPNMQKTRGENPKMPEQFHIKYEI